MPKFSFIVSVHNSERYLAACLDSILEQSFDDFELIAVNDGSTDGSGRLLDSYSKRDSRVTAVHLNSNVGAGGARNTALERATGEYLWCIDSDDWIVPGALSAVAEACTARPVDVLMFPWTQVYDGEPGLICVDRGILKQAPKSFALHEWPRAVHVHHMPWNKVVRRKLIESTGFRFPVGWHQDLPFTYTMLSAAECISTLPTPLVMYRKHGEAATATRSSAHLCLLDQWALVFELVERHAIRPDLLRPHLVDRMLWHLTEQLKKQDRLPMADWPEFARRAAALWRANVPRGHAFPRGVAGLKYRLIARYPTLVPLVPRIFAVRKAIRSTVGLTRGWDHTAKSPAGTAAQYKAPSQ